MLVLKQDALDPMLRELQLLLWGPKTKQEIWERWSQGFEFSPDESTALIQRQGGPCAVIAPVQAFLIKNYLADGCVSLDAMRDAGEDKLRTMFLSSLAEILTQAAGENRGSVLVVLRRPAAEPNGLETAPQPVSIEDAAAEAANHVGDMDGVDAAGESVDDFFKKSTFLSLQDAEDMTEALAAYAETFTSKFGVMRFLYSVLLTKGLDALRQEVEDSGEALIDGVHGHGSQSLINLFLTGKAVTNVWDLTRDVGGLCLQGIPAQNKVGFLTTLEHHRYCEVGSFLKNPLFPVWLLGSETHLSVLFSFESNLTAAESPRESAYRIFKSYDPDGNGFIPNERLSDVMSALNLVSEPAYVEIMQRKLDSESLGIILRSVFMEEFFPTGKGTSARPHAFTLYHYNGLGRSCPDGKVVYQGGAAEITDGDIQMIHDPSPALLCIQTKWQGIDISWSSGRAPSLN